MDNPLTEKELRAVKFIRNAVVRGRLPSVRDLQSALGYRSPRSAADILQKLSERGIVRRREDGRLQLLKDPQEHQFHARTVDVPLVGQAPCGQPLLAVENTEAMIPVSTGLARPAHRYFLLRATGDSMSKKGIEDGALVLVRQQPTASNGDIVVALIDDEATIKEYHWSSDAVILRPRSRDPSHQPIVVTTDFNIQGVVVAVVPFPVQET